MNMCCKYASVNIHFFFKFKNSNRSVIVDETQFVSPSETTKQVTLNVDSDEDLNSQQIRALQFTRYSPTEMQLESSTKEKSETSRYETA